SYTFKLSASDHVLYLESQWNATEQQNAYKRTTPACGGGLLFTERNSASTRLQIGL
ncbi:MAG: hypothetical protein QG639_979, partial [Patescibacteria group bacterium]|nr:hypothetical protein [Patescibacteria group bacterium]